MVLPIIPIVIIGLVLVGLLVVVSAGFGALLAFGTSLQIVQDNFIPILIALVVIIWILQSDNMGGKK